MEGGVWVDRISRSLFSLNESPGTERAVLRVLHRLLPSLPVKRAPHTRELIPLICPATTTSPLTPNPSGGERGRRGTVAMAFTKIKLLCAGGFLVPTTTPPPSSHSGQGAGGSLPPPSCIAQLRSARPPYSHHLTLGAHTPVLWLTCV